MSNMPVSRTKNQLDTYLSAVPHQLRIYFHIPPTTPPWPRVVQTFGGPFLHGTVIDILSGLVNPEDVVQISVSSQVPLPRDEFFTFK
jgi:hypothetical protein